MLRRVHGVLKLMTDVFFFVKSLMGKKLGWKKFANQNMFLGQGSYPNQKVFQYDGRSHDMIRSDRKILIFVKSLMGTKLELICIKHIFVSLQSWAQGVIQIKICLGTMKDLSIWFTEPFFCVKSPMGTLVFWKTNLLNLI